MINGISAFDAGVITGILTIIYLCAKVATAFVAPSMRGDRDTSRRKMMSKRVE
jgi:hypothetical protein